MRHLPPYGPLSDPAACAAADRAPAGLHARQLAFALAILDSERPVPPGLVGPDGTPSAKRFAVYRNNVVVGLMEALGAAFPATRRIVGEDFFAAMARIYVSREPPRSPVMLEYGAGFADFVGAFEPAAELPYLRDVARLERAWVEAYHAPEAEPFDPAAGAREPLARLLDAGLVLHPSVRVVRSPFPVVSIWEMNIAGGVPGPIAMAGAGEDALVSRPGAEVEVRLLPAGGAAFIAALACGAPIVGAADAALGEAPSFDLADALAALVGLGAVVGWSLAGAPVDPKSGEPA